MEKKSREGIPMSEESLKEWQQAFQDIEESIKLVANNKKAYHDYFIEDKYECGLVLHGTEDQKSQD